MPPPTSASTARTIHAFFLASTSIVAIGAFVARRSLGPLTAGAGPLDFTAILVGLSTLTMVILFRSRLPARGGVPAEEWWRVNVGRAVLVWALLEFPVVIGAIALFATGHVPVFAILSGLAFAGLVAMSPGRLAAG